MSEEVEYDLVLDRQLGELLAQAMSMGLRLRDQLTEAEAALRRADELAGLARERVEILRKQQDEERALATSIWEQLRQGIESRRRPPGAA